MRRSRPRSSSSAAVWVAASDPKVCSASARIPAICPLASASTSAKPPSAPATCAKARWAVSRCGGISATRARNRSPSLPTQAPESSPRSPARSPPAMRRTPYCAARLPDRLRITRTEPVPGTLGARAAPLRRYDDALIRGTTAVGSSSPSLPEADGSNPLSLSLLPHRFEDKNCSQYFIHQSRCCPNRG